MVDLSPLLTKKSRNFFIKLSLGFSFPDWLVGCSTRQIRQMLPLADVESMNVLKELETRLAIVRRFLFSPVDTQGTAAALIISQKGTFSKMSSSTSWLLVNGWYVSFWINCPFNIYFYLFALWAH